MGLNEKQKAQIWAVLVGVIIGIILGGWWSPRSPAPTVAEPVAIKQEAE